MTPKAIFGPSRAPRSSDSSYVHARLPTRFQEFFLGHLEASKISALSTQHMYTSTTTPCAATTRLRPHALYVDLAVRRDYSSPAARALHQPRRAPATTRLRSHALYVVLAVRRDYSSPAARALRQPCRAPRLLVTWSHRMQRSTSTTLRVWVPRHVARLVTRLVAPLVVDYSASRRLVAVDYFAFSARPGALARRAARHAARRTVRRRLLRLA
jgi:hypothetical protein